MTDSRAPDYTLDELTFINRTCSNVLKVLKDAFPQLTIDQLGAAMVYSGSTLLVASSPEMRPYLKNTANFAYQCLAQSRQTK